MSCVPCVAQPDPCDCSEGQMCQQVAQTCSSCSFNQCVDVRGIVQPKKTGLGGGTVGGIAAAIAIAFVVAVTFLIWKRRKSRTAALERMKTKSSNPDLRHANKLPMWLKRDNALDVDADLPAVKTGSRQYNRPSSNNAPPHSARNSNFPSLSPRNTPTTLQFPHNQTAINLDPFADSSSFISQAHSDDSSRIIRITDMTELQPLRPPRAPGLVSIRSTPYSNDINDNSQETLRSPHSSAAQSNLEVSYGSSRQSVASGFSSMSNSSFLDVPTIITPVSGGVRKVQLDRAVVVRMAASSPTTSPLANQTLTLPAVSMTQQANTKEPPNPFDDGLEVDRLPFSTSVDSQLSSAETVNLVGHVRTTVVNQNIATYFEQQYNQVPSSPSIMEKQTEDGSNSVPNSPHPSAPSLISLGSPSPSRFGDNLMSDASSLADYQFQSPTRIRKPSTLSTSSSTNGLRDFDFSMNTSVHPLPDTETRKSYSFPRDV